MNRIAKLFLTAAACCLSAQCTMAANDPKTLAAELTSAIEAKDLKAAVSLVEWDKAPIIAHRLFKMSIADCFAPAKCKIEVAAISEEEKKPQLDYHFAVSPEGKLKITSPDNKEGLSMPFAKINNQYKIILGQQTKEAYLQAKAATDALKIAQDIDPDLVETGQPLPKDGGEPAVAYREYLAAITKGDLNYLAQHGSAGDRYSFGNSYKNNPVKADIALDLSRMESVTSPMIKGGFIKDNKAILLVSGTNGQGWITEGAVLLMLDAGKWSMEDKTFLSYPPN